MTTPPLNESTKMNNIDPGDLDAEKVRDLGTEAVEKAMDWTRRHPWQAFAAAVGAGVAVQVISKNTSFPVSTLTNAGKSAVMAGLTKSVMSAFAREDDR